MNPLALQLISEKAPNHSLLLNALSITVISAAIVLPATAQISYQDSYLPPEVIPINQSINYGTASAPAPLTSAPASSFNFAGNPGLQSHQTPQEARRAIYDMLAQSGMPTQNQTSYNETINPTSGQSAQPAQSLSNTADFQMPNPQNSGWQTNSNFNNPNYSPNSSMNNSTNNSNLAPVQTQTLGGAPTTDASNQTRSGGVARLFGMGSMLAGSGVALGSYNGGGNLYSTGLFGAGLLNYGARNGLKF